MDENAKSIMNIKFNKVKKELEKRRFLCDIVEDASEARNLITELIPVNASVSLGGSVTLTETRILKQLYEMDIRLQDRYQEGLSEDERKDVLREAFTSDIFVTSTNALTMQGELYNIDATGNRVAAMAFGPKKVIVVVGQNKLVSNIEEAENRLRSIAAPMNCTRLNRKTPCTISGECMDCLSEERLCANFVRMGISYPKHRVHIILIKEDFGY